MEKIEETPDPKRRWLEEQKKNLLGLSEVKLNRAQYCSLTIHLLPLKTEQLCKLFCTHIQGEAIFSPIARTSY